MKIGLPLIIIGSFILILFIILAFAISVDLIKVFLPIGIVIFIIMLIIGIVYLLKEKSEKFNNENTNLTCDVIVPCIPTHIKFLEEFVKDMKNQTRQPNRIIIALSQTNEKESKKLEKSLNNILNKVSVISTEKIQKSWDNRDRGAVYSTADIYCFLDADDRVHPQRIEAAMDKFEKNDVELLLCEGSSDNSVLTKRYNKDTFTYITGQKIYDEEIKKRGNFPIEIRHFDVDINYNTGVIFIDSKLWWSIGGQTNISMKSKTVLENNGVGEDIVFIRTIINKMADKSKFIIIRNPLLVKRGSSSRNETHWKKDPSISENKTLPEIAKLIKKRIKDSKDAYIFYMNNKNLKYFEDYQQSLMNKIKSFDITTKIIKYNPSDKIHLNQKDTYFFFNKLPNIVYSKSSDKTKYKIYVINAEQLNVQNREILNYKNVNFIDYSVINLPFYSKRPDVSVNILNYQVNFNEIFNLTKTKDVCYIRSNSDYRKTILKKCKEIHSDITCIVGFGKKRDDILFKHKILINVSYNKDYNVLEQMRVNRCIYNRMIIISDKKEDYGTDFILNKYIIYVDYDDIPNKMLDVINRYQEIYNDIYGNFDKELPMIDEHFTKQIKSFIFKIK